MLSFLVVFLIAAATAYLVAPVAIRWGHRWQLVAQPGGRRRHAGQVPVTGWLSISIAFLAASAVAWWLQPPQAGDRQLITGVLLGAVIMLAGGILDDRWDLPPRTIFLVQIAAAAIAMGFEVFIERFTNPLNGQLIVINSIPLVVGITLFWMLGMINTVNFLDGLDGLATGVGGIAALLFAWHSYNLGQTSIALFPMALAGALFGLLPLNFSPGRIFLGSGAYLLGYLLASFSILAPAKIATALLVLAVPIWDIAWQIYRRLRRGRSPFKGDRGHLHYRLADAGLSTRRIVIGYYLVAGAFGLVAIFATGLLKLILLTLLTVGLLAVFAWLTRHDRR